MSTILVEITPPGGSPTDYASACVFERCTFNTSMNAAPGSFDIMIRDPHRTLSFATGSEIVLTIDGIVMFGGYVTQVTMTNFAPAADTSNLSTYDLRAWRLSGADYNILFDRRVWRDDSSPPTSYLSLINLSTFVTDGSILRELVGTYADMTGFGTSNIEDNASIPGGDQFQQGDTMRKDFERYSFIGSSIYYIRGDKEIIFTPFENVTKTWGFSDAPNGTTTIGYREIEAQEDGSFIENDVFIWGGSQFAGTAGGTVVARVQDSTSEATYGRWQFAQTHFGELYYKTQAGVDSVANAIVLGPPGQTADEQQKGLRYSQWQFTFTWFAQDVPSRDHLIAGDIVQIDLTVFSLSKILPMRSLAISFPDAFENDGSHQVQFQGVFGLQNSDPFTLWAYLMKQKVRAQTIQVSPASSNNSSTTTPYGGNYQGTPTPVTDGSTTLFTIPFGYVAGTLQVYMGDIGTPGYALLAAGVDYTETDPGAGTFTLTAAPANTKSLYATATTLGTVTGGGTGVIGTFPGGGANTQAAFEAKMADMTIDILEIEAGTYTGWHIGGTGQTPFTLNRSARPLFVRPQANATVIWDGTGVPSGDGLFYIGHWTTQSAPVGYFTFDPAGTGGQFLVQSYALGQQGIVNVFWAYNVVMNGFHTSNLTGNAGGTTSWNVYVSTDTTHVGDNLTFDNWISEASPSRNVSGYQQWHPEGVGTTYARNWTVDGSHFAYLCWGPNTFATMSGWTITNCDRPINTDGTAKGVARDNTSTGSTSGPIILSPFNDGGGNSWG